MRILKNKKLNSQNRKIKRGGVQKNKIKKMLKPMISLR